MRYVPKLPSCLFFSLFIIFYSVGYQKLGPVRQRCSMSGRKIEEGARSLRWMCTKNFMNSQLRRYQKQLLEADLLRASPFSTSRTSKCSFMPRQPEVYIFLVSGYSTRLENLCYWRNTNRDFILALVIVNCFGIDRKRVNF